LKPEAIFVLAVKSMLASVLHNPGCGRCSSEKEQTSREIRHRMESQVKGNKTFFLLNERVWHHTLLW
jgi:hypothetical protein